MADIKASSPTSSYTGTKMIDQNSDIGIGSIGRFTNISNDNSKLNKFPKNLLPNRSIEIKIYDTPKLDPNKALAQTAGTVINESKAAYKTLVEAVVGEEGFFESLGAASGTLTQKLTSYVGAGNAALDAAKATFKEYGSTIGIGNARLAPIYMDTLFLPLPNEIAESLNHHYSDEPGLFSTSKDSSMSKMITSTSNKISKATGTQSIIYNENKINMFEGSDFRSITLSWTLIPNSKDESQAIQTIITKLKAYSSPQAISGKALLRAPFFCKLSFPNAYLDGALQFYECVMTNIEVNYSTSGHMETFKEDDTPKTMTLSITFQDREPKTLQAWAEGQSGYDGFSTSQGSGETTGGQNATPSEVTNN